MIPAIRDIGGVRTLVVDDEPFVILGAQCDIWRSTRQDRRVEEFIDAYRDMNATAISFGIPWAKMERERDSYEFSFLDWFIDRTAAAGLKLIVNLFNTNVCGKCEELTEGARYPQYTPDYIKNDPGGFTRIVHNVDIEYHPGGPPLCPNDPATLDREARYLRRVALHLKEHDRSRTVIMVQLNNEYFYQQWAECKDNTQKHVRCVCGFCTAKYDAAEYSTAEAFMFTSFAEYTRTLTDAFKAVYPLPIYVNSPWWAPYIIDIFLRTCPNLDFVGIDGVVQCRRAESAHGRSAWKKRRFRRGVADGGARHEALSANAALLYGAEDEWPGEPAVGSAGPGYGDVRQCGLRAVPTSAVSDQARDDPTYRSSKR